ncbi:bromodomain-containing protein 8 [Teleopsis dalmanni]|uniref:bromodomain-containing protein 8 n=1 Tax=Teleopsis dalmanni TaxID=139649 RepID=UPI0018CF3955|nr:bromodomain-containing protein 8 [Teleopsis dalmanni]XP_037948532.1 bromodomain-containing protein 8 [Teleopsis dalmanni]
MEPFNVNHEPLDNWTLREKLVLVSTMSINVGQDWSTVSKKVKDYCGKKIKRPDDWFSPTQCQLQYTEILLRMGLSNCPTMEIENIDYAKVDAAKRKLTDEHMVVVQVDMRRQQEEYAQIHEYRKILASNNATEEERMKIWVFINQKKDAKRIEEMKLENQMRERDQKRREAIRNWQTTPPGIVVHKPEPDTTAVDMDVEEIVVSSKPISTSIHTTSAQQPQIAPSPLLSSLLKSPNSGMTNSSPVSARNTAPTITTLLTSGSIPNPNQPVLTLKSHVPAHEAVQMLTRPISGPPVDSGTVIINTPQNLLSPSQSAPTLSMLLEKNKSAMTLKNTLSPKTELKNNNNVPQPKKIDQTTASDVNHDIVPMDIEKGAVEPQITNANGSSTTVEVDETDPIEEQQLMEVFKHIGTIEEMDIDVSAVIDEEDDFLKVVGDSSQEPTVEPTLEMKDDVDEEEKPEIDNLIANDVDVEVENESNLKDDVVKNRVDVETSEKKIEHKIDVRSSSDDSIDNIPLASVASQEAKDQIQTTNSLHANKLFKEKTDSEKIENNKIPNLDVKNEEDTEKSKECKEELLQNNVSDSITFEDNKKLVTTTDSPESQSSDVIIIPTDDDDSNGVKHMLSIKKEDISVEETKEQTENAVQANDLITEKTSLSVTSDNTEELPATIETQETETLSTLPVISIDTDEESSTTDVSTTTRKDDRIAVMQKISTQSRRGSSSKTEPKIEDENSIASISSIPIKQRRRYSSTKAMDSFPNSPASSDREERETRSSKKPLMTIINVLQTNKNLAIVQNAIAEMNGKSIHKPFNLQMLKKNVETGVIRNISDLQLGLVMMCQNVIMCSKINSTVFKAAVAFKEECRTMQNFLNAEIKIKTEKDSKTSISKNRTSSTRKSLRIT